MFDAYRIKLVKELVNSLDTFIPEPVRELDKPFLMPIEDIFTIPANLAGLPGISFPCGNNSGLPLGVQLIGNHLQESSLLKVAHNFQLETDWHLKRPII